jgi:hypothetical protein
MKILGIWNDSRHQYKDVRNEKYPEKAAGVATCDSSRHAPPYIHTSYPFS